MNNTLPKDLSSGFIVDYYEPFSRCSTVYQDYLKNDKKKIKKLLKQNPDIEIKYYHNWVRIGNQTFNGFSKEDIDKLRG